MVEEKLSQAPESLKDKQSFSANLTRRKFLRVLAGLGVVSFLTAILGSEFFRSSSSEPQQLSPPSAATLEAQAEASQGTPTEEAPKTLDEKNSPPEPKNLEENDLRRQKLEGEKPNFFETLMSSFLLEADKRRLERQLKNPESLRRINPHLNHLYSVVLLGYGETYEPPVITKPGMTIGSYTIICYDSKKKTLGKLSLSHDFYSPEVAKKRFPNVKAAINPQTRISDAYLMEEERGGGFDLMREVLEDATGLFMDFELAFSDQKIKEIIDDVFLGVEVEVRHDARIEGIYFQGKFYLPKEFKKGKTKMNGLDAIQYIKGVPIEDQKIGYQKELEHHQRETSVLKGLKETFSKKILNPAHPLFTPRLSKFALELLTSKGRKVGFDYDFDWQKMIIDNLLSFSGNFAEAVISPDPKKFEIPDFKKTMYFADDRSGSEIGVSQRDENGNMFLPINSNRFGDPVNDYWKSLRNYLEKTLQ